VPSQQPSIPSNATSEKRAAERRKLLGAVNSEEIELFPYFGDEVAREVFTANISEYSTFPKTDSEERSLAAPAGTLLFADVSCSTEFRPWIFGNPSSGGVTEGIGLRQMPLAFMNFRLAYGQRFYPSFHHQCLQSRYGLYSRLSAQRSFPNIARSDVMAKLFVWQKQNPPPHEKFNIENDDQALQFLNIMTYPQWYQVDANKALSAFISDFPSNPKLCDPPGKLNSICAAPVLHGSRPATRGQWEKMYRHQWWAKDEKMREGIPIQIPALELNAVYTCNLQCEYCAHLGRYIKGHVPLEQVKETDTS